MHLIGNTIKVGDGFLGLKFLGQPYKSTIRPGEFFNLSLFPPDNSQIDVAKELAEKEFPNEKISIVKIFIED
jgi:hypothetical protein